MEVTTLLKIPQQGITPVMVWAVRVMHHRKLALHWRTTLAQKLPADYLETLLACKHYIINLHQIRAHDKWVTQMKLQSLFEHQHYG